MTPLFPDNKESLIIQQGPVDDCYLLVSLDCIFNSGTEARELLKSKFTQTADGVTVRIKRNIQSANLKSEKMKGKYTYSYDRLTDEDIFFLSNKKLKKIDDSVDGVVTNSLAVKILERISSYYYIGTWDHTDLSASLKAHSISQRHAESSTLFVGRLLGISAKDSEDINKIIKLKLMNPEEAIYISCAYGVPDLHGKIHQRHALRIDKVTLRPDGEYEFSLVNPWNNQKRELFTLTELKKRDCRFCTFNTNQQKAELASILLKNELVLGQYIFANPDLFPLLFQMQKTNLLASADNIQSCITLHQQMPFITSIYNSLLPTDQVKLIRCIVDARGDKESFLKLLITNIPRMDLLTSILQNDQFNDKTLLMIKEMALESRTKLRSPTRTLFEGPQFFSLIMHAAIHHKAGARGCSLEQAQQLVEMKILNYFFDDLKEENLSQQAGLRDLFVAKIFSKASIENWFTPKLLLAYSLNKFLNTGIVSKPMTGYIERGNPAWVDEEFLNEALANYSGKPPRELFVGLYQLNQINPLLVKALFPLVSKRIKQQFGVSAELFAEDIVLEKPSEFKNWWITMYDPKLKDLDPKVVILKRANRVVNACLDQLNSFVVPVEMALNSKTIALNCTNLIRKLENIVTRNVNLPQSQMTLGFSADFHPGIMNARVISRKESLQYLQEIKFLLQIEKMHLLVESFEEKAELNKYYKGAAEQGRTLYETLLKAQNVFLSSGLPKTLNRADFKKNCLLAIRQASPALSKHPDWKQAIEKVSGLFEIVPKAPATIKLANQNGTFFMRTGTDLLAKKPAFLAPLTRPLVSAS